MIMFHIQLKEFEPRQTSVEISKLKDEDIISKLCKGSIAFNDLPEHLKTLNNAILLTESWGFQPGISKEFQEDPIVYENMCSYADKVLTYHIAQDGIYKSLTTLFQSVEGVENVQLKDNKGVTIETNNFRLDNFYGKYLDELSESFILYLKMRT